jgi:hypothetical protein
MQASSGVVVVRWQGQAWKRRNNATKFQDAEPNLPTTTTYARTSTTGMSHIFNYCTAEISMQNKLQFEVQDNLQRIWSYYYTHLEGCVSELDCQVIDICAKSMKHAGE